MNGGAWLNLEGMKVDVLLRDFDVVLCWVTEARRGAQEVDALPGYLAGAPTYTLMAELALNRTVHARLPVAANIQRSFPKLVYTAGSSTPSSV